MPADWYCEIDGKQEGPLTSGQLKELAMTGHLLPAHPVWREGMQTRVPAEAVKGLFDRAPVLAPAVKSEEELIEFEMVTPERDDAELIEFEMIAEIVEDQNPKPPPKPKPPEKKKEEPPEVVFEAKVVYREGLPDVKGPLEAELTVEKLGVRFHFTEEEFFVSFEKIDNVREPRTGDWPPAMKKKALASKVGGMAGKLAAGLMGRMIGGDAGDLVSKVGGQAGQMASSAGDLGNPPRNRLTVIAKLRKERCKVFFDANGTDWDEMSEKAAVLFKQIEKARKKFASAVAKAEVEPIEDVEVVEEAPVPIREVSKSPGIKVAVASAAATPITSAGKPFRVMSGGKVQGPYSLEELRGLFATGKLGGDALIGVETWLPRATLGGLIGTGPGAAEEEFGDFEAVEEEEKGKSVGGAPSKDDGDAIPVDKEFMI